MGAIYLEQIARLTEVVERLAAELEAASKTDAALRRLRTIPGIGPVTAGAVAAFAPRSGHVRQRAQLRRLARPRAAATVHGRQGQTGIGQQNGPDRHP
jgi:transposase